MIRRLLQKLLQWIEEPEINIIAPCRFKPLPIEKRQNTHDEIIDYEPEYKTDGAAGFDIKAYTVESKPLKVLPHNTRIVPTGLFVEIPQGYEMQIRSRSGLASKGIVVANSPGTIDSDYRGEIQIILMNHSSETFTVNDGDRIAQGVITRVSKAKFQRVHQLSTTTKRGDGGFGHTGI